jgi:hypothetical protein
LPLPSFFFLTKKKLFFLTKKKLKVEGGYLELTITSGLPTFCFSSKNDMPKVAEYLGR